MKRTKFKWFTFGAVTIILLFGAIILIGYLDYENKLPLKSKTNKIESLSEEEIINQCSNLSLFKRNPVPKEIKSSFRSLFFVLSLI